MSMVMNIWNEIYYLPYVVIADSEMITQRSAYENYSLYLSNS